VGKTRYQFKVNLFGPDADPQAIGEEIEALIDAKKEHVTPEELVAAGRSRNSALHPVFTFDDIEAGDKWRNHEARRLTTQLHLADKKDPDKASRTRAFIYVKHPNHDGKRVLLSMRSAMARSEFREQAIEQAVRMLQRQLDYWTNQFGTDPRLRRLVKDVDKLRKRAERELLQAI